MSSLMRFHRLTALIIGSGAGIATYKYLVEPERKYVSASWTNSEQPVNPCALWDQNWDFREPKSLVQPVREHNGIQDENRYNSELERASPKVTRHIILVRHGEYLDNGDSDCDHHLTERGRLQAKYVGQRLHELNGIKWDKVIVSTMTRAKETADIILKEIGFDANKAIHCSFIREGAPIPPQPPVGHWRPEESFFRDGARIEAGFRRYFHRAFPDEKHNSHTLIVGHGNVIRYFVCRALQFPPEAWLRINVNHASITWLTIAPSGRVTIKYLGDTGYIPAKYLTNRIPRDTQNVV